MKKNMFLTIAVTIALTGCASFIQTKKANFNEINTGISYYLPKRQHRLAITAEHLDPKIAKERLEEAIGLFHEKNKLAEKLKSEWGKLSSEAKHTPVGEDGADAKAKASALEKAQTAEGIYKAAKDVSEKAKEAMNEAQKQYDHARANVGADNCNYYITMDITPQPLQPDTNYPFLLKLNPSYLRDDELKIKTTHSGLLTSADVTSTDRTGDIAVEIAKAVAMLTIPAPAPPTGVLSLQTEEVKKECHPILKYDEIVDFEDDTYTCTTGKSIDFFKDSKGLSIPAHATLLPPLNIYIQAQNEVAKLKTIYDDYELSKSEDQSVPSTLKGHYGILYRRDATYLVQLRKNETATTASQYISMPNLSPVSLLPYKYRPFVTTKNNAVFENGMLVSYDTNQPSSAMGLAQLPAKVIEGYILALTHFLQLKIDYSSEEIAALGQEKELADLRKSLQDTLKEHNP